MYSDTVTVGGYLHLRRRRHCFVVTATRGWEFHDQLPSDVRQSLHLAVRSASGLRERNLRCFVPEASGAARPRALALTAGFRL